MQAKRVLVAGIEIGAIRIHLSGAIEVVAKGYEQNSEDWFTGSTLYRQNPLDRLLREP